MVRLMEVYLVEQLVGGTDNQMVVLKVGEKEVQQVGWMADQLGFQKGEQSVGGKAVQMVRLLVARLVVKMDKLKADLMVVQLVARLAEKTVKSTVEQMVDMTADGTVVQLAHQSVDLKAEKWA